MIPLDWFGIFGAICTRGQEALKWGLPEAWVHAELYAELKKRSVQTGWEPFSTEVPYVTFYPVQLPSKAYRDWRVDGAVKWVDLCLRAEGGREWCWLEFKVRHAKGEDRQGKATLDARDAVRKDAVALMGFDAQRTAEAWLSPDEYTKAYWFEGVLKPYAEQVRSGRHHFVATFLQLEGKLDEAVWHRVEFVEQVWQWFAYRSKQSEQRRPFPSLDVAAGEVGKGHSLLVCRWGIRE